jgi:hypothetical protein
MGGDEAEQLRPYLQEGETLRWTGRPATGLRLSRHDPLLIPFSLVWLVFVGGFVLYGWTRQQHGGFTGPYLAVATLFLPFGFYFALGRFYADAWARSHTVYGLTGERAIVLRRASGTTVLSHPLDGSAELSLAKDGSGDIDFGVVGARTRRERNRLSWTPALDHHVRFIGVREAALVYRKAQRG